MSLSTVTFMSAALRRPIEIYAIFPSDKCVSTVMYLPEKKPFQTLYFLEGMLSNHSGAVTYTRLQAIAEENNVCVITVGGENMHYADSDVSLNYYDRMVANDLIKFTRQTFNLSTKREDTFIGGFSMGGFGAVNVGLRHPDIFSHIVALSPGLVKPWMLAMLGKEPGYVGPQGFNEDNYRCMYGIKDIASFVNSKDDSDYLAEKVAAEMPELMPKFFISVGTIEDLRDNIMAYYALLKSLKYDVTLYTMPDLGHSWHAMETGMTEALTNWLPLDTFRGNFLEFGPKANLNNELLGNMAQYYNCE